MIDSIYRSCAKAFRTVVQFYDQEMVADLSIMAWNKLLAHEMLVTVTSNRESMYSDLYEPRNVRSRSNQASLSVRVYSRQQ